MLKSETFKYSLKIREHHLDSLGHVNNARYLTILEEARWDLLTKNGYGLDEVKQIMKGPIVIESYVKYLKELKNLEEIIITTQVSELIGNFKIKIVQEILKENQLVAAKAVFTMGVMDLNRRKAIPFQKEYLEALGVDTSYL